MKSKISVEKSRVGFLVFLSIAFVSSLVLGYNGSNKKYTVSYGSQHGWVCPVNDDSAGKRTTWTSSENWPNADGINDPHPGRDYFTLRFSSSHRSNLPFVFLLRITSEHPVRVVR